jgi:serine/threonine protein kinase
VKVSSCEIGAFGEVRMCVHRDTGAQRAVKVLRKSHMDDDEKKMLFNEINILRELVSALFFSNALFYLLFVTYLIGRIFDFKKCDY